VLEANRLRSSRGSCNTPEAVSRAGWDGWLVVSALRSAPRNQLVDWSRLTLGAPNIDFICILRRNCKFILIARSYQLTALDSASVLWPMQPARAYVIFELRWRKRDKFGREFYFQFLWRLRCFLFNNDTFTSYFLHDIFLEIFLYIYFCEYEFIFNGYFFSLSYEPIYWSFS